MKKFLLMLICGASLTLVACATNSTSNNNQSGITTYGNTPDNPMVNSKAASSEEFPQENQM
ncbi:MAG: hypothetical protein EKK57_09590 [Proteobacteria bacterium]|nr:MAG: hypothetical protein EKK57_09590 [Pseudomonadota bacterium]